MGCPTGAVQSVASRERRARTALYVVRAAASAGTSSSPEAASSVLLEGPSRYIIPRPPRKGTISPGNCAPCRTPAIWRWRQAGAVASPATSQSKNHGRWKHDNDEPACRCPNRKRGCGHRTPMRLCRGSWFRKCARVKIDTMIRCHSGRRRRAVTADRDDVAC